MIRVRGQGKAVTTSQSSYCRVQEAIDHCLSLDIKGLLKFFMNDYY